MSTRLLTEEETTRLKQVEIEIFDELDRVCRKHNIEYYMVGGTLLGAVRHGGFIPWDDDIDVVMYRSDLEKLESLYYNGEFDNKYFLQTEKTDDYYPLMTAKLRKNDTMFLEDCINDNVKSNCGIFIDIFPLDDISDVNARNIKRRAKLISLLTTVICEKCGYCYGIKSITKLFSNIISLIGVKNLKKIRHKLMTCENNQGLNKTTIYASNYGYVKQCRPKDVYAPAVELSFERKKYMAHNKYDEFLVQLFGRDYMELPPVEKRVTRHPIKNIDFGE